MSVPYPGVDPSAQPGWDAWSSQVDPTNMRNTADLSQPNYTPAYRPTPAYSTAGQPAMNWAPTPEFWYGAQNPAANSVYYDPQWGSSSAPYGSYAVEYGTNLVSNMMDQYAAQHQSPWMGFNSNQGTASNPGAISSLGGDWQKVDAWNSQILAAVQKVYSDTGVYVPPNFVKSIMKLESGGDPNSIAATPGSNGQPDPNNGARGLMQVMPGVWGNNPWGLNINDPAQNIELGVHILADNYKQGDPNNPNSQTWEWAAKRYLGLGGQDAYHTTDDTYWQTVNNNWIQLQGGYDTSTQKGMNATPGTNQFTMIYGGIDAPIAQGFGPTPYSASIIAANPGNNEYDYGKDYTPSGVPFGHTGIDVGVNYNTKLYAPEAGVVSLIGSQNPSDPNAWFFTSEDENGNPIHNPQGGEFLVTTANGDQYVLGHMNQIVKADGTPYKVGDPIQAGDFVGYSGRAGSGPHVHIEYRQLTPGQTKSGYTLVDPSKAFNGTFTGAYQGTGTTMATEAQTPNNWQNYLEAAIKGQPLNYAAPPSVGGFHDYLFRAMQGLPPVTGSGSSNALWMTGSGKQTSGPGVKTYPTAGGIVGDAEHYLNVPYVYGHAPGANDNPLSSGWDCSGFTYFLDQKYGNRQLPQGSHYQYQYGQDHNMLFQPTNSSQLQPGDLLFFDTGDTQGGGANLNAAGHVGVYIGNGQMISAMNQSAGTAITGIDYNSVGGPMIGAMHWNWKP